LEHKAGTHVVLNRYDVDHRFDAMEGLREGVWQPTDEALRDAAVMPHGTRYAHRGIQLPPAAAAACLLAFMALLTSLVLPPHHPARMVMLLVSSGVVLVLVTAQLHRAADQHEAIVVDEITADGLATMAGSLYGFQPSDVAPWRRAARPAFVARPSLGCLALLAACGLAILVGVTELSWGSASAATPSQAKPVPVASPAMEVGGPRAALRRRVAGPATGLMIAGLLGLLPELLAVLLVPAFVVVQADGGALAVPGPALPVAAAIGPLALPVLLAQEGPPMPVNEPIATFLLGGIWIVALLVNLVFSVTILIGGWRMRQLKSHGLAMVAAVLAILPCSVGWILGLPMGIWALSVLREPEVREAFES
jgi:hypothetical protein